MQLSLSECPFLVDAGVASSSQAHCCASAFGPSWNGCSAAGCYVRDAAALPPQRACAHQGDRAACLRAEVQGGAWTTQAACCAGVYGAKGCASFPSTCYAADASDPGRCAVLRSLSACGALMDLRMAWHTRAECCAALAGGSKCLEPEACWMRDDAARPHRACKKVCAALTPGKGLQGS